VWIVGHQGDVERQGVCGDQLVEGIATFGGWFFIR
jgi:hypothetical protein